MTCKEQYEPQYFSSQNMDPNLPERSNLEIGIGDQGSLPRVYPLADDRDINVGFLKIILSTDRLASGMMEQGSPFKLKAAQEMPFARMRMAMSVKVQRHMWDAMIIPLIVSRGVKAV